MNFCCIALNLFWSPAHRERTCTPSATERDRARADHSQQRLEALQTSQRQLALLAKLQSSDAAVLASR
jgi:hypothetical protein